MAQAKHTTQRTDTKVRVLLADDHPAMLQQEARVLRQSHERNFEIVGETEDGRTLLEMAEHVKADVAVLDISMPGLSGLEVARQLLVTNKQIRLVFLTVHDDPDFAREAFASGAWGYVVKSRLAHDLCNAITSALEGRSFVSPTPALMPLRDARGPSS